MVLSIFLSIISIFNNLYVIIFQREIVKNSIFISVYTSIYRSPVFNQWIAEGIDKEKFSFLFLMNPKFHNKKGCEEMTEALSDSKRLERTEFKSWNRIP